ncbi:MAG: carboxypeptidase regulatory-like domain-containing protein [Aridibacter famidurans]|nr:carboxypeptidase regulatory-like domain-containing protein [Aridibacter famidurans]
MFKTISAISLAAFLPIVALIGFIGDSSTSAQKAETGTLERLIVSSGTVSMKLDLGRLNGDRKGAGGMSELRFDADKNALFAIVVFEDELRGPVPGELPITPNGSAELPGKLGTGFEHLMVERSAPGSAYEFVVRDRRTWYPFFNIEGQQIKYDNGSRLLNIEGGRMLVTDRFANDLGRKAIAGTVVGEFSLSARMRQVEVTELADGEIITNVLPSQKAPEAGTRPGPDVVVGDVYGLAQFGGSSGSQVGLALGTVSCNYGEENLNWFALPNNDHPVIPQNLYRMSGGTSNDERFEQIGQSHVKHAFTALTQNICGLGCNGVGGSRLGSGCSDPYSASLNSGPNLGSKAWINPFTGDYPRGDSATPPNNHSGHSHVGPSHRILTEISDLSTSQNPGATYYAEGQYVTPHEYQWCQSNPGECNMYNNVSYRQYSVSGTGSPFSFSAVGSTVREKAAVEGWPGATVTRIEPDPGNDGIGMVAYKVTNTSPGVWHYEYAVYNQNLDRAIQSFSVPLGDGVSINNIDFHAPPQHPGWSNDGTVGGTGFSSADWTETQTTSEMKWSSETFGQNANANAIRWGTMYNFRFDSTSPPEVRNATVGFFKTGAPITVEVLAPAGAVTVSYTIGGRVTDSGGRPIKFAYVILLDSGGEIGWAVSNNLGYYQITGVAPGTGYTIGAKAKNYSFNDFEIDVNDNVTGVNLVANP